MLATRTSERNHQILEAAGLIIAYARIDQRNHVGQKLADAILRLKVFDNGGISPRQRLETLFTARIRKTAPIEDESPAVSGVIHRQSTMKRKTRYPHRKFSRGGSD